MRMTMVDADELQKRLRASMPIRLDYVDPFTQQPVSLFKEDVIRLLFVKLEDFSADAQMMPALYVEFARAQRACEYAKQFAEGTYRAWKAQLSEGARANAKKSDVKFTEAMGEAAYRTHPDYAKMSSEPSRWELYGNLFADLKEAVKLKERVMDGALRNVWEHEVLQRSANAPRRG